jgi:hypothetical protein
VLRRPVEITRLIARQSPSLQPIAGNNAMDQHQFVQFKNHGMLIEIAATTLANSAG